MYLSTYTNKIAHTNLTTNLYTFTEITNLIVIKKQVSTQKYEHYKLQQKLFTVSIQIDATVIVTIAIISSWRWRSLQIQSAPVCPKNRLSNCIVLLNTSTCIVPTYYYALP